MRFVFILAISFLVTSSFLTIEWFTIWAWVGLSFMIAWFYDCYCTSQENLVKITNALIEQMKKISSQMSTESEYLCDTLSEKFVEKDNPKPVKTSKKKKG